MFFSYIMESRVFILLLTLLLFFEQFASDVYPGVYKIYSYFLFLYTPLPLDIYSAT